MTITRSDVSFSLTGGLLSATLAWNQGITLINTITTRPVLLPSKLFVSPWKMRTVKRILRGQFSAFIKVATEKDVELITLRVAQTSAASQTLYPVVV